jgi:two-component system, NarL family, nitrate/nitrite response regulator NarL
MRLILGDDQAIFLDALSTVLAQRGYDVGAVARSPEEMIAHVRHQRPDACLLDCNLAIDDGIGTIRRVIEACPTTIVVVLSADPDADAADRAMDAGASGYLHQSRGVEVLVTALERVLGGERVVDVPGGSRRARRASHADNLAATLTGRERECLSLLVAGMDTAAMVEQMGVSRTTVRTHLQSVLTKLCVHSRLEAASFAVRHRLVDAWADPAQAPASVAPPAPVPAARAAGAPAGWRSPAIQAVGSKSSKRRGAGRASPRTADQAAERGWDSARLAASG